MATSTAALVFMLVAAYSCKFVRVVLRSGIDAPFYFGIWKTEGGIAEGQGYLENTNACIAWTDTAWYADGGLRAAKVFSVLNTFGGTCLWFLVGMGVFQPLNRMIRVVILVGACLCAVLSIMFFCAFAAEVCDELTCHMGAASYLTLTATALWMTTAALSYAFTASLHEPSSLNGNTTVHRDLVTVATTYSTPTVPTGTVPRTSQPYRHGTHRAPVSIQPTIKESSPPEIERRYSAGVRTNSTSSGGGSPHRPSSPQDPWQEQEQHRSSSLRSSPVDLDEEVGVDDLPPIGCSPLISITEDDRGNLIRTTITRTVDSQGRTIIDRTSEVIPDNDNADTASV